MRKILLLGTLFSGFSSAGQFNQSIVVASDGTFLGTCEGEYGNLSIGNPYSQYGGKYGVNSMYNPYSLYGSEYSITSPYNKYSNSAPYFLPYTAELYAIFTSPEYRRSSEIAKVLSTLSITRVSVNKYVPQAVDPDVLRVVCENP